MTTTHPSSTKPSTASSSMTHGFSNSWITGFTTLTNGLGATIGRGANAGNCPTAGRLNAGLLNAGLLNAGLLNPARANPTAPNAKLLIPNVVPITAPARIKPSRLPYFRILIDILIHRLSWHV